MAIDGAALEGLQVLVVEDDPDAQQSLCRMLESAGARVSCAASALEALRLAAGTRFDVVVSDLVMPGHDGLWLARQLLQAVRVGERAPFAILLTGWELPGIAQAAHEAGYDLCLQKPVDLQTLVGAIPRRA
jgi:two-component system CheB/CheR fusion protein